MSHAQSTQVATDYYPVNLSIDYPPSSSRALAFFSLPFFFIRMLLLIPALFCLYFVGIAAMLVVWFAFWGVTFTGHYPAGMFQFVSGYMRWQTRTSAYLFGLTDEYPPFRMRP
jgi:Domain of unknown function (DUF4389)